MKIKPYIEKLNNSPKYKEFKNKYDNAFMVAGFFILDLEFGKNIHQIDFYVPSEKKIAAFTLDGGVNMQLVHTMGGKVPEELDLKTKIDLDALPGILLDEMKNRSMTEDIKKIIAIIQNINGKKIWNLSCILSGMEILRAHVEDESKTVLKMEKSSMMDLIKKMPVGQGLPMQDQGNTGGAEVGNDEVVGNGAEINANDLKEKIKKLAELQKQIEKEKQKSEEELSKKPAKDSAKKAKSNKK